MRPSLPSLRPLERAGRLHCAPVLCNSRAGVLHCHRFHQFSVMPLDKFRKFAPSETRPDSYQQLANIHHRRFASFDQPDDEHARSLSRARYQRRHQLTARAARSSRQIEPVRPVRIRMSELLFCDSSPSLSLCDWCRQINAGQRIELELAGGLPFRLIGRALERTVVWLLADEVARAEGGKGAAVGREHCPRPQH